jgi:phosphohistidine phosphatase
MRRLILMRHAKSSWAEEGQRDHDRPLNARGRRDAAALGAWLNETGRVPDAALVSTARRTQETWALLGFDATPMTSRADLYHAAPETMLAALRSAPDVETVLMLGHQPGIGASARMLLAEPPAEVEFSKYPTTATSVIEFSVDAWRQVSWGAGRLADFTTPKAVP